jgi:3-oxoacyl-[acyl-carrier-protein] synthase-3
MLEPIVSAPGPTTAQTLVRTTTIAGLGTALPVQVVENATIADRLGVGEGWIERRTGISRRRHASGDERVGTLAASAATAALANAGIPAASVDLIVLATLASDHITPASAPEVAHLIGAHHAGAYDIGAACTGFITALATGSAFLESGRADTVLVIGVEVMSRFLNRDDRRTAALFGDGAGAAVLTAGVASAETAASTGVGPAVLGSDGSQVDVIRCTRERALIEMDGHDTFLAAVTRLSQSAVDACTAAHLTLADIDLFVFHQANARILTAVTERLDLPSDRVVNAIGDLGNTSAASIPLALAQARDAGQLRPGDRVLCAAFGAGLTWGACVLTWSAE